MKRFLLLAAATFFLFVAKSKAQDPIYVIDSDGNGSEFVLLSGSTSFDLDGAIIDYQWNVNGSVVASGFGPVVQDLNYNFLLGRSTVTLTVRDDAQVSASTTTHVVVLPQGTNKPPVAVATVPSQVMANGTGVASVPVDASASFDPDNDPINRYQWTESSATYYDGGSAVTTLSVTGLGAHVLTLTVYSTDGNGITQHGSSTFTVTLNPPSALLAGRQFTHTFGQPFPFDPPHNNFAAIAFDALSQTYFVTDRNDDKLFETHEDGSLIRTIDIAGLNNVATSTNTDARGIAWMHGNTFALALHTSAELAVVNILSTTTALSRSGATIYSLSDKPTGMAYSGSQNAFYLVKKNGPMRVTKGRINTSTGQMDIVWKKDVDNLPAGDLSEVAVFPRLHSNGNTDNLFLLSSASPTVMEVDLSGATGVLESSFTLTAWPIPKPEGLTFNQNGQMIVTNDNANVPQDDFTVFSPTAPIANQRPVSLPGNSQMVIDSDGNGSESVNLDGSASYDPDGELIHYAWLVNGSTVSEAFLPNVGTLTHTYALGKSTVTLVVWDDAQVSSAAVTYVTVFPQGANKPPVAVATVPSQVMADGTGAAAVPVDASASFDPDNDPINRYQWTESTTTYYDGGNAVTTLSVNGLGAHVLMLTVYSTDSNGITQHGSSTFTVTLNPPSALLAGRQFTHTLGQPFPFDPPHNNFAAIAFDALTQTYFVTDRNDDKVFETHEDGSLIRTIDIVGLNNVALSTNTDARGIAWMHGTTFALALHTSAELAVVNILSTTTALSRSDATIYSLSDKPTGMAYSGSQDVFYLVKKNGPMRVTKERPNASTGQMDIVWKTDVDNLPVGDLSEVAVFPRLHSNSNTDNLFLLSSASPTVMEVDLSGTTGVLKSSFTLTAWPIPKPEGLTFNQNGQMIVTNDNANVPQDDFSIFSPTATIPNLPPVPLIHAPNIGQGAWGIDLDGSGKATVTVDATQSFDPDGAIIHYSWSVNGVIVAQGDGPKVPLFPYTFDVGTSTLALTVEDDVQVSSQEVVFVKILPKSNNLPPIADASVPGTVNGDVNGNVLVNVDATASSDPDGDKITRYTWIEGSNTYYDGPDAVTALSVQGFGQHDVTLTVYSTDSTGLIQSGAKDFFLPCCLRALHPWQGAKNLRDGISTT